MEGFEYFEPRTVEEACRLLEESDNAKVLAGGASLVALLKNKLIFPERLVNLKTIPGLDAIEVSSRGELRIGALCRHRDIESSPLIRERFDILVQAASSIASPPIRNMGTIGGDICHAEPSADFPPALIALNAKLKLAGAKGSRAIPIDGFFTDSFETVLNPDEILTEILIPPLPARAGGTYMKLDKTSNSTAIVGIGAVIALDEDGTCTFAGLGIGGAAPTPLRIEEVADLTGTAVDDSVIESVASAAARQSRPISDAHASAAYRKEMVAVFTRRALSRALEKARRGARASLTD